MSYSLQSITTGLVGAPNNIVFMSSTDTYATITTAGYLSSTPANPINPGNAILVGFGIGTANSGVVWLQPLFSGTGVITLIPMTESGSLITTINHLAVFLDTHGTLGEDVGTAIQGGNLQAGLSGTPGYLTSFPTTASKGSLRLTAVANSTDTVTTISNASMGQASVISIPDPGVSTANFLLSTGSANILTDFNQIVGINNILIASVGTWTRTRIAEANYVLRHTAADDTSVIGIDITPAIRAAASKGFRLASVDVIYSIATAALDAHTLTLDQITYANNAAVAITSVPLTGTLAIATQAQPYVSNIAVTTPAFLVTADSKYVLELTVNAAATSAYDYYGLNLKFSQTIG